MKKQKLRQLLSLDTSTLGALAKDAMGTSRIERNEARSVVTEIGRQGFVLVVTAHQLIELMQHGDDRVVESRLLWLRNLPSVAWIQLDKKGYPQPGLISHVLAAEVFAVIAGRPQSPRDMIALVRPILYRFGSGLPALSMLWECWNSEYRNHYRATLERSYRKAAAVASVCAHDESFDEIPFDVDAPTSLVSDIAGAKQRYAKRMATTIETRGDPNVVREANRLSEQFAASLPAEDLSMEASGMAPHMALLKRVGLGREDVIGAKTVGDVSDLTHLGLRLRNACQILKMPFTLRLRDISADFLVSWQVGRSITAIQRKAHRVKGSDFNDAYVASLSPYCDVIEGDKRTVEYVRQLRQSKPELGSLIGDVVRVPNYRELPNILATIRFVSTDQRLA